MNIVLRGIDTIQPYEKNAKKHDQRQIDNVAESIKQFGFVQPIVIDKEGTIIIGHCRYEASKKLELAEVPCYMAEELTEEQVKELRLLDNKLNESAWDYDLLAEELKDLDLSRFDVNFGIDSSFDNFDEFFEESQPKDKEPKKVQCPHCGEWFEV